MGKVLTDDQLLLVTLLIQVGVMAALASILIRSGRFGRILFQPHRTLRERWHVALLLGGLLGFGVFVRILLNYNAADLSLIGTLMAGLVAGPITGSVVGLMVGIPAALFGGELLAVPMGLLYGLVGGRHPPGVPLQRGDMALLSRPRPQRLSVHQDLDTGAQGHRLADRDLRRLHRPGGPAPGPESKIRNSSPLQL
ncbi:MAG: hypothetical protein EXS64_10985 [Candidatus Latescibacteria bacterium]|nr:hypothetical protein [Candidatus Latescibacterota bacterium]